MKTKSRGEEGGSLQRRILLYFFGCVYRLYGLTLRFKFVTHRLEASVVVVNWHQELFSNVLWGPLHKRYGVRFLALISRHRDGDIASACARAAGLKVLRGNNREHWNEVSSQVREAFRSQGMSPVFALDGPLGPYHKIHRGALEFASEEDAPIMLMMSYPVRAYKFERAWDHFLLPYPFTSVYCYAAKKFFFAKNKSIEENVKRLQKFAWQERAAFFKKLGREDELVAFVGAAEEKFMKRMEEVAGVTMTIKEKNKIEKSTKAVSKEHAGKLLELKNLSAGYGESLILHGVTLDVDRGERVALVGPNGAGKSTILRSIFSLTKRRGGSIHYNGWEVYGQKSQELVRRGIVYVNQGRVIFSNLTIKENLTMPGSLFVTGATLQERVERALNFFPVLKDKLSNLAITLSGGQRQQLALARALVQEPKLLLLDEPTLGLSPILQKELFAKIVELSAAGVAILMVEQNARMAIAHAHRTYLLENGAIALTGGAEIIKHPVIKKVYLGG